MTPLRQRMTEDMQLRGLALATQQAYLRYVEQLALFTGQTDVHRRSFNTLRNTFPDGRRGISSTNTTRFGRL